MNPELAPDQQEIYDFLLPYQDSFVSVNEISKRLGSNRRFENDRMWALPILRRMELDGLVESNPFGEYKVLKRSDTETSFFEGLKTPGTDLGDTNIISFSDIE